MTLGIKTMGIVTIGKITISKTNGKTTYGIVTLGLRTIVIFHLEYQQLAYDTWLNNCHMTLGITTIGIMKFVIWVIGKKTYLTPIGIMTIDKTTLGIMIIGKTRIGIIAFCKVCVYEQLEYLLSMLHYSYKNADSFQLS